MTELHIAVLPGDGIGSEITPPTVEIIKQLQAAIGGFTCRFEQLPAGAQHYKDTGESLPKRTMDTCRKADAVLLACMGMPSIRYQDGTEISPQIDLRMDLDLYAGVRPVRVLNSIPTPLANPEKRKIDFILIRESTEGLFASHGKGEVKDDQEARDTMVITRRTSERLFDFALKLGQRRKADGYAGRVTCVDKANVFKSFAFFRKIFDERAKKFPDVQTDYAYVDATALNMVKRPWDMDVLVTENMFGDILSDLGAGLMGGMGMAPSGDIGDEAAVFQPCHGSAPDIAGEGKANPSAMILSAALMLDWLGDKHQVPACRKAASILNAAVDHAFESQGLSSFEMGGNAGTQIIASAVQTSIEQLVKARK